MTKYASLELTISSPAQVFTEPIDARQMRTWLGLTETDPDEDQDAMIESLISAARHVAESFQGRDLITKQYDMRLDAFCSHEIELHSPLQSVELVQYTDYAGSTTTLVAGTDYIVDTARALLMPAYGESWPTFTPYPSGAVLIRFTSGYTADHPFWLNQGQQIIQGMRMLVAAWHEGRLPFIPNGTPGELPFAVTALFQIGALNKVG
jgi:uncharacterized phiE125 gp8 family phage protein